jgi:hypothetical protein
MIKAKCSLGRKCSVFSFLQLNNISILFIYLRRAPSALAYAPGIAGILKSKARNIAAAAAKNLAAPNCLSICPLRTL